MGGAFAMRFAARPALARILVIDHALRESLWLSARVLGQRLEVSTRTIRRDIDFMRDRLNAPIKFDPRQHGFCYTEQTYRLPFLRLTEGELVALFLAEQLLRQYRGTPYGPDLARAFDKLTCSLTDPIDVDARRLGQALSFRTSAPAIFDVEIIRTLIAAILKRRQVKIDYWTASRNSQNKRRIDPYHLMECDGQYYLFAYCHMRKCVRQFVPGRIRAIELTDDFFTRDDKFEVNDYLSGSMAVFRGDGNLRHTVRLRFTGTAVPFVRERLWHPGQQFETTQTGGLELSFAVSHLREAERMVLTWAPDCEALAPEELRASVAKALARAARMHSPGRQPAKGKR